MKIFRKLTRKERKKRDNYLIIIFSSIIISCFIMYWIVTISNIDRVYITDFSKTTDMTFENDTFVMELTYHATYDLINEPRYSFVFDKECIELDSKNTRFPSIIMSGEDISEKFTFKTKDCLGNQTLEVFIQTNRNFVRKAYPFYVYSDIESICLENGYIYADFNSIVNRHECCNVIEGGFVCQTIKD